MLAAGKRAPEFTARNQNDQPITLADLLRSGPLILCFYPSLISRPDARKRPARCATCTPSSWPPGSASRA